jgi:hypothetical protein
MILSFALFGMVMTGNNVFATDPDPDEYEEPGEGDGGGVFTCYTKLVREGHAIYNSCKPCEPQIGVKPASDARKRYC